MRKSRRSEVARNWPPISANHALLLDFDGTLVDLASTPDAVKVPRGLPDLLVQVREKLSGALCIVTGRTITDIDHFMLSPICDVAAEHGAAFRFGGEQDRIAPPCPESWKQILQDAEDRLAGLVVERKPSSVALHYRKAPKIEAEAMVIAENLLSGTAGEYVLQASNMTIEIKRPEVNKGKAIQAVMSRAPYRGRTPVFAADDVFDECGFEAVRGMNGLAINVCEQFNGDTAKVREWLTHYLNLESPDHV